MPFVRDDDGVYIFVLCSYYTTDHGPRRSWPLASHTVDLATFMPQLLGCKNEKM